MEILGLTADQLLILAGIGLVLFVILILLKFVLKLTVNFIKLGCLGVLVILLIAFIALWTLPG
ncbi:MAG: hypothetical protein SXV54_00200 [Chloroflexota bacterium]|nr:hypothetical protein [Chloroflexota bacterium]